MRSFIDSDGQAWDVTVGRESFGMLMVLFVPAGGGGGVRKAMLASDTRLDAQRELEEMTDAQLRERLADAVPWEAEDPFSGQR